MMATQKPEDLLAEIALLKAQLVEAETAKTKAQELATSVAAASAFVGTAEEQPSGNTVIIDVCLNPGEKDEKKQKFKEVEYPTYFYTSTCLSAPEQT
jgi:hypothetical protein